MPVDPQGGPLSAQRPKNAAEELEQLRQRVSFYEEFDQIIRENVGRSGELLRRAAETEAAAGREVASIRLRSAEQVKHHHDVLLRLQSELAALQSALTGYEWHLNQAVAEFAGAAVDPLLAPAADDEHVARGVPGGGFPLASDAPAEPTPPAGGDLPDPHRTIAKPDTRQEIANSSAVPTGASGEPVNQAVIVHGMSDVTRARSLVEHLRHRPGITRVDPKEFAGGVLRLMVIADRPVGKDDVGMWNDVAVEVAETSATTLVIRLATAPTL